MAGGAATLTGAASLPAGAATDVDVIVVGAGAAGLSATADLMAKGFSVRCVEARNRIGGRAVTDTSTFGVPFDRGAHWLHTRKRNPWVKIGKKLGFDVYKAPDNYIVTSDGKQVDGTALWAAADNVERAIKRQAKKRKDKSLSAVAPDDTVWDQTAVSLFALSMGIDADEISVMDWWSAEGGADSFCRQGFGAIVAKLHAEIPVTLDTQVRRISVRGDQVEVATSSGTLTARACILTVPLGVLQTGAIKLDPAPGKKLTSALNGFRMGTYNHSALLFKPGTFDAEPDTWAMPMRPQGAPPTGALVNASGHPLCVVESSGSSGRALEKQGKAAMVEFGLEVLVDMFGTNIRKGLIKSDATRWGQDQFSLGCYSAARIGAAGLRKHFRRPIGNRVFLAGEHCHPGFQSTVAGAHMDGARAAVTVAELLS
ncbi:MAG: FAD-dependent oxidoreductase [Pseudomonadota bacterium]